MMGLVRHPGGVINPKGGTQAFQRVYRFELQFCFSCCCMLRMPDMSYDDVFLTVGLDVLMSLSFAAAAVHQPRTP